MRMKCVFGIALLTTVSSAYGAEHLLTPGEVFDAASPSVVVLNGLDQAGSPATQGSGVVIAPGIVVSNCHVLTSAQSAHVAVQGTTLRATLRHSDTERDICSFTVPGLHALPARLGGTASLKIGDRVYSIGAPRGFELTLADGLISSLRPVTGGHLLQITAPISPGSSGGGLFDSTGSLVGITTMQWKESQQLNFAIPVEWIADLPRRDSERRRRPATTQPTDAQEKGRLALNALGAEMQATDPAYAAKLPLLLPKLATIKATLSPDQWEAATRRAYTAIHVPNPSTAVGTAQSAAAKISMEDGRLALNALGYELQAQDPEGYAAKLPQLVEAVSRIKSTRHPSQWGEATRRAYATIALPPSAGLPSQKLLAFERAQSACKTYVLGSRDLAMNFQMAGAGSLSDACSCAATLSISTLTEAEVSDAISIPDKASSFARVLLGNFARCVQMAPAQ